MMSDITTRTGAKMPTASLPAPSLSPHVRLPARWLPLMASNDMIYRLLLSIRAAILQARSDFLPELREDGAFGSRAGGRPHSPSSRKILSRSASRSGARGRVGGSAKADNFIGLPAS